MKKIVFFFNELKATFWFIPVVIILSSIFLAVGLVSLDHVFTLSQDGIGKFFLVNSADSARSILSTISGAMIGVAGTVFSVTLVALTLASSQFGPRLIRNFMYVQLNQIVLGSYISTYLYSLFILNAIKEGDSYTFIPVISILVAIFAACINIILLIVFIHQIAVSIQADHVISDISDLIYKEANTLYPKKMGEDLENSETIEEKTISSKYIHILSIKATKSGYIQYVDGESLMKNVCALNGFLKLSERPGSFLVENMEIGVLYTNENVTKKMLKDISNHFVIGKTRLAQQDIEFSIHQMVEIAVRALSPGVNDPFTAIACIDNLTATLSNLAQSTFPSKYRVDKEKNIRILTDAVDFEGVLNASFNQIRQFAGATPAVIIRLMEALTIIYRFADKEMDKKSILIHANMLLNLGKATIKEENDLQDLLARSKKILPD